MERFDVVVVGGGPAGMMAAGHAAEYGRRVLLVEKNPTFGEKLNLTGGGRCNITNAEFDTRTFLSSFGDGAKFLFSPFSRFAVRETFDFFAERGLPLVVEERKRAFPETHQAADVTRVLAEYMQEHGVEIRMETEVKHLLLEDRKIVGIETDRGSVASESVILATGSAGAAPDWLRETGHTVHAATPDIVPLRAKEQWVKDLSGTTLDPMKITFTPGNGKPLSKTGKILFTHFGVSGPLILNSAHEVKKLLKHGPVAASIDLFPDMEPHLLDRRVLEIFGENKNKLIRNVAKQLAPTGMARAFAAHLPPELLDKKVNVATQEERKTLVLRLKGLPFTITGTMGYDWAVVCDGGIDMDEVDTRTMVSRLHPNLFIIGDLLHLSRPSGGFSLQLCWTTGWIAGENA